MQVHLHLCLGQLQDFCYFLVGLPFDVSQQHDAALHLGQAIHEFSDDCHSLLQVHLLGWLHDGGVVPVGVKLDIPMSCFVGTVECKSATDGVSKCLYGIGVFQLIPALPYPDVP